MISKRRTMRPRLNNMWMIALGAIIIITTVSSALLRSSVTSPSFSLLVTLIFQEDQYKQEFLGEFSKLAKYVRQNEPSTIAYELLESDQDPLRVLILERYQDKDTAYLEIHKSSEAFLEFRPKLKAMQEAGHVTIDGHSYKDSRMGFVGRE